MTVATVVIVLSVFVRALNAQNNALTQLIQQCSVQNGLNPAQALGLLNPFFQTSDEATKCVLLCVAQQSNLMSANGQLVPATVIFDLQGLFNPVISQQIVSQCQQMTNPATACDTAYMQWQCLIQATARSQGLPAGYSAYGSQSPQGQNPTYPNYPISGSGTSMAFG